MSYPALALLELASIPRGMVVGDALVKRAAVQLLRAHPIDPGKYLLVFEGEVAEVEEALQAAAEAAAGALIDRLYLSFAHEALAPAIAGRGPAPRIEALGIVETPTLAASVVGLDKALKTAPVRVVELRLGAGLGGKGYFVLTGDLYDMQASLEAAVAAIGSEATHEIIAQPHADFLRGAHYA